VSFDDIRSKLVRQIKTGQNKVELTAVEARFLLDCMNTAQTAVCNMREVLQVTDIPFAQAQKIEQAMVFDSAEEWIFYLDQQKVELKHNPKFRKLYLEIKHTRNASTEWVRQMNEFLSELQVLKDSPDV
jgi:PHD/YefM family antitoxin component YafN of YafNO toxin-antitoxin module